MRDGVYILAARVPPFRTTLTCAEFEAWGEFRGRTLRQRGIHKGVVYEGREMDATTCLGER